MQHLLNDLAVRLFWKKHRTPQSVFVAGCWYLWCGLIRLYICLLRPFRVEMQPLNTSTYPKKYAVMVVVFDPINIGDDFQALAQIELLKKAGVSDYILIDREQLKNYRGEPVNMLLNGWFMHDGTQFPPAENIFPIFTSIHITATVAAVALVTQHIDYWLRHEPIGCRDLWTCDLFKAHGIKAYLSKCATLTFDEYTGPRKGIYLADVDAKTYPAFFASLPFSESDYVRTEHYMDKPESIRRDLSDYPFLQIAASLLDRYRKAELVITSRLHAALPCRAMGTPVLFVEKDYRSDPRFLGLESELNGSDGSIPYAQLSPEIDRSIIDKSKSELRDDIVAEIRRRIAD